MRLPSALLLIGLSLPAQIYVVDAAGGPGSQFTSIATAVATVPDGAVLQVRAGSYGGFAISGKSLTVLGEAGVLIREQGRPTINISNLLDGQTVVLRDLTASYPQGHSQIECLNSNGTILLDRCAADHTTSVQGGYLVIRQCARVHLRGCSLVSGVLANSALTTSSSNVGLFDCDVAGLQAPVLQAGGRLDFSGCTIRGFGFGTAMQLNGGDLRLRGQTTISGSILQIAWPPAISGNGDVAIDPGTVLTQVASPPFGSNLNLQWRPLPNLSAAPGPPGGTSTLALNCPTASLSVLMAGLPGPPFVGPASPDPIWLLPATLVPHAFGGSSITASHAVPNAPWVLGVVLAWQGAGLDPARGLLLSNVAAYVPD